MPVMMISETENQTEEGYNSLLGKVSDPLKQAPGFVLHMSHATPQGWRVIEVWESRDHAAAFFAAHIAPKLPAGLRPKLTFQPLHDIVHPEWP
ncbi:hypothetical protein [Mesorhizobium sp. IMUNJ 23232]|uniref:hypothetical protein n=1 Tax=Mesorhizobium sp. IMUNJ 23232 TaxID=3376064 RepID=UPI0037BD5210